MSTQLAGPKPSQGDRNALRFIAKTFGSTGFTSWNAAQKSPQGYPGDGLAETGSGWDRRLKRLSALGWTEKAGDRWYVHASGWTALAAIEEAQK